MATFVGRLEKSKEPKLIPPQPLWWKVILVIAIFGPILATICAMVLLWQRSFFFVDLVGTLIGCYVTILGIGASYHRQITHRGFLVHPFIKFLLLVFASMAWEGSAIAWAADHWYHHKYADKAEDLHSPHTSRFAGLLGIILGFLHAHIGWLFLGRHANPRLYVKYLYKDPVTVLVSDTFLLWAFLGLFIPFLIHGWQGLLWIGFVRICLTHQVTFMVNSVCHIWGSREFDTDDMSTNNVVVAAVTGSEGFHHNHHECPRSAKHGFLPGQFDLTWEFIHLLFKFRLADSVYVAQCEFENGKVKLDSDGEPIYTLVVLKHEKTPSWVESMAA
jgi:stearoyl-CoA desaturase (delta-9 desaturase)